MSTESGCLGVTFLLIGRGGICLRLKFRVGKFLKKLFCAGLFVFEFCFEFCS